MPQVIKRDCHTCGKPLDPKTASIMLNHPSCDPVPQDLELMSPPPPAADAGITPLNPKVGAVPSPEVALAVKAEFTTMLLWSESARPRSQQVNIGPSELGVDCDRQLAYRVAGLTGPNEGRADPWPGFVGSAIHARMEEAIRGYLAAHPRAPRWAIEQWVQADPLIRGKADYNRDNLLVDIKSASTDGIANIRKEGPTRRYRVQQMVYAKGLRDAGRLIEYICLLYVPRSGWLRDAYVWAEPYDEALALESLGRPYRLAQTLRELDVTGHPNRWDRIPATPSYMGCQYCPMWDKYLPSELGATDKSCPGYQGGKK